jgi:PPP family 3-phenylpropionic acid transporter
MLRFALHYFVLYAVVATLWPYFPAFLRARGFSEAEIGFLQGCRQIAEMTGPLLVAFLSERLGRRRALISACLAGFAVAAFFLNRTSTFVPAALLAAAAGLSLRTTIPLTDTLAATELPDPAHNYGRIRIGGSLGFIATLVLARVFGLVNQQSSWSMTRAMLALTAACLVTTQLLPESHSTKHHERAGESDNRRFDGFFWAFMIAAALQQLGMSSYYAFFTLYVQDVLHMPQGAWVWAIGPVAEMPFLFFAGRITRRFRLSSLLIVSAVGVSVRLGIYALVPVLAVVLAAQLLHSLTFGLFHATCIEFIRRRVPAARRAVGMGIYMSISTALPLFLGSSAGGVFIEKFGYSAFYGTYALIPLLGILLIAVARARGREASHHDGTKSTT